MAIEITQWCNEWNQNVGSLGKFETLALALEHFHKVLDLQPVRITLLFSGYGKDIDHELDAHEPQTGDTVESFLLERERCVDDDSSCEEAARQAGMVFGCQGYNDVMGY